MNSNSSSRRRFLSRLALAGAALPLTQIASAAKAEQPKHKGKIAVGDSAALPPPGPPSVIHAFSKVFQVFSYADASALCAEAGFGGIDFTVRPGGHVEPEKAGTDLPRAVEAARKAGLKTEVITTAIVNARDPLTEPLLRTAAKLGIKQYRFGNLFYDAQRGIMGSLQRHKEDVKELEALNKSLGLHGCHQNHAGARVGSPIWDFYELIKDADPRWIGVQYDISHAMSEGGYSWPLGLKLIAPWIKCTDVKDFVWKQVPGKATVENVPIGEGVVDFDGYFKLVRQLGIGGPISIHFEHPPFTGAPKISMAEKRTLFLAGMKKDVQAIKNHLAKHRLS